MLPRPTIYTPQTTHTLLVPYSYPTRAGAEPEGNRPPHAAGGAVLACCDPEAAHASTHASGVQSAWRVGESGVPSAVLVWGGRSRSRYCGFRFFFFHKP